jgi:uncharacterized protein
LPSSAPRIVVADAGPLIALARVNQLSSLPIVLGEVLVPLAVRDECLRGATRSDEQGLVTAFKEDGVLVSVADAARPEVELRDVDRGEASVLSVALDRGYGVLMDDRRGRRSAEVLGVPVIGTVGVLVLAKRHGLLKRIKPQLEYLVASGYHLSPSLCRSALQVAGER